MVLPASLEKSTDSVSSPAKKPHLQVIEGGKKDSNESLRPSRTVIVMGLFLALLQVLDGVLTGIGISHFGIHAEGNILLRFLMIEIGHIPALVIAKSIAIAVVGSLCFISIKVPWVPKAMGAMIALYLGLAVIPWGTILALKLL